MSNILICDDEKDIVKALEIYLSADGYEIYKAYDGIEALEVMEAHQIDLVLLDVMMPKMDGIQTISEIRKISNVPVIFLTAKAEDSDMILGLNIGADDYITKPFNPVEVQARVKSSLRRYLILGSRKETDSLTIGGIELNPKAKEVTLDGEAVSLTPTEFKILELLMERAGEVVSPREIYVDLLDKEMENPTEKEKEYLEILTRQSNRLKKLIQDLIDASKATTGNVEVKKEAILAGVILDQAMGEFEEKLKDTGLEVCVGEQLGEKRVLADGRHLWRVFDNLLSNICKYAQPGTRVYVDTEEVRRENAVWISIVFRNISREKLNISPDELMERFTRGDSSRNTEGSGLGLNIANSLLELMDGKLEIEIDGDLFKARVLLREVSRLHPGAFG